MRHADKWRFVCVLLFVREGLRAVMLTHCTVPCIPARIQTSEPKHSSYPHAQTASVHGYSMYPEWNLFSALFCSPLFRMHIWHIWTLNFCCRFQHSVWDRRRAVQKGRYQKRDWDRQPTDGNWHWVVWFGLKWPNSRIQRILSEFSRSAITYAVRQVV